ncbi:hypothetical protein ACJZ2D_017157 [Fusarium nematophilum]
MLSHFNRQQPLEATQQQFALSRRMDTRGRPPKSVNFHWRRFRIADIPLDDQTEFDLWLREEWYKKDALMEEYLTTGRFPRMVGSKVDYIETEVKTRHPWEILQIFTVVGTVGLISILSRLIGRYTIGSASDFRYTY